MSIQTWVIGIFEILRPSTLDEALELLYDHHPEIKPIAGGTELLILIRDKRIQPPKYLLDLSGLKRDLSYVKLENGQVRIGALTTIWELSESILHRDIRFAGFRDVWRKFGTMALRFTATIGGNIATATDYSDYLVLLLAYDAMVRLENVNGDRIVPLEELVIDRRTLNLSRGELITEIVFKEPPMNSSSAFEKFDRREILIAGIANGAALLHLVDGRVEDVKVSFDMVRDKRIPRRAKMIEEYLKGKYLSDELLDKVAEDLIPKYIQKFTDWWTTADYRLEMTKTTFKRTISRARKRIESGIYE